MKGIQNMEITWKHSLQQVEEILGVTDKPWIVNPFWEMDVSAQLDGKQLGELPMEKMVQMHMMQDQPSIIHGFNFLREKIQAGGCLHNIWDDAQRAADPRKVQTGLYAFPVPGAKRFLLIVPGGGYYNVCSFIEGFPFAKRCNELGISAFVLQYRTFSGAHYPNPQEDAAQAVRYILDHAEAFDLAGTDYAVCGFSAGGHLAASFAVEQLGYGRFGVPKPQAVLLGYPVITMTDMTHDGSRQNLLAEDANDDKLRMLYSVEKQVTVAYPPTYLWNCEADCVVPAENSAMLESALRKCGVPVTHEIFPGTVHGWGLGIDTPAEGWFERAIAFWNNVT